MPDQENNLRDLVAEVAAAYFSNSHVTPGEIPNVISQIASSLRMVNETGASNSAEAPSEEHSRATPAQVRKSITPDALISLEDGRPYKTLKRHLSTRGLTLEQYRAKWGLPNDYPSVAPNYSERRSAMAKQLGLGQKGKQARGRSRSKASSNRNP